MAKRVIAESDVQLAVLLDTNRKSIRRWRTQFRDCPKDRDVAAWWQFMEKKELGPHSAQMRCAETPPTGSSAGANEERELRIRERRVAVEREELKLAMLDRSTLKLSEYQNSLREMLTSYDAALRQVTARASEKLVEATRQAMLALLHAKLTPKQFEKLAPLLDKAPLDYAAISRILEDEIEACRMICRGANFLDQPPEHAGS